MQQQARKPWVPTHILSLYDDAGLVDARHDMVMLLDTGNAVTQSEWAKGENGMWSFINGEWLRNGGTNPYTSMQAEALQDTRPIAEVLTDAADTIQLAYETAIEDGTFTTDDDGGGTLMLIASLRRRAEDPYLDPQRTRDGDVDNDTMRIAEDAVGMVIGRTGGTAAPLMPYIMALRGTIRHAQRMLQCASEEALAASGETTVYDNLEDVPEDAAEVWHICGTTEILGCWTTDIAAFVGDYTDDELVLRHDVLRDKEVWIDVETDTIELERVR